MGTSTTRFVLCLFLSYPFALPFALPLPPVLRHLYTACVGVLFTQFAFGAGWVHLLAPSVAVYAAVAALRAVGLSARGTWLPAALSFGYLIFRHLSRVAVEADGLDDSTLLMVLVVKLYTLCYNLFDAEVTCAGRRRASPRRQRAATSGWRQRRRRHCGCCPSARRAP